MQCSSPNKSELGKKTEYDPYYNPDKLFAIPRKLNRETIGIYQKLPFYGYDIWNHYEVSWLNNKGKPYVGFAEIIVECDSLNIIESKSMKLYFNSFNNTQIENLEVLKETIKNDLEEQIGSTILIKIIPIKDISQQTISPTFEGICIDELDLTFSTYTINPTFLFTENATVDEVLYSDLLKSNCLVTNQPDWGSVQIAYKGKKINHEGLLRYIVSFRNCNDFSEQCIERIFMDIMSHCSPQELTVYGRFTRRGGIDINPLRTTIKNIKRDFSVKFFRQ